MKKILKFLAAAAFVLLSAPLATHAQVFSQSQVIITPYGGPGFIVSTTTANGGKLQATTTPFFNAFNFNNATGTKLSLGTASTTNLVISGAAANCNTTNALTTTVAGTVGCTAQPQGTVTAVSVATSNGFAGSSGGGATPILTITTSVTAAVLKGNGTAISGAVNGTDYTLITAKTCTLGDFVSSVTAAGVFTCTTPSGGTTYTATFPIQITGSVISSAFSTTSNSGMAQGNLYVGTGGIYQTSASSSIFGFTPASNAVTVTLTGTANQISSSNSSAQALTGNVSSTFSLPNHVIFPVDFVTIAASTTNATTTGSQYFTGITLSRPLYVDSTGKLGPAGTGTSGNCTQWGANNTFADAGSPCGSGAGSSIKYASIVVAASGGDTTSIQTALDTCGTMGGAYIYLTDTTYAQAGTGLRWKGSNCQVWGRGPGTTTITFTGATTLFKTNSAVGLYTHNELHNLLLTADGNTSGIAIDWSDMTHGVVDDVQTSGVGTSLRLDDTQNITFYNQFSHLDFNDNRSFCINASSTNAVNANTFDNIFCGSPANVIGIQLTNGNGNSFNQIFLEPASLTGTVGLKIFTNKLTSNGGVWNNTFDHFYDEANGIGVLITNDAGGTNSNGIQRNTFSHFINESNTTDWSVTDNNVAQNTFDNAMDSNFSNPINTWQGPFGISTSTALRQIGTQPYAFFGVNCTAGVAQNCFVIGSSTKEALIVDNASNVTIKNTLSVITKFIGVIGAAITPATAGEIGIDTTDSQLKYFSNSAVRVLSPVSEASFTYATSSWTGTTTIQLGPAIQAQTWTNVNCYTDVGTLKVQLFNGASKLDMASITTSAGNTALSTNNSFAANALRSVDIGNPASSPKVIACTISKTTNAT